MRNGCMQLVIEFITSFKYRHGFQFSESNIFRVPNGTFQDGNDTLVSFYAIYPDGLQGDGRFPVPRSVLLSALNDRLEAVVESTQVDTIIEGNFIVNFHI